MILAAFSDQGVVILGIRMRRYFYILKLLEACKLILNDNCVSVSLQEHAYLSLEFVIVDVIQF